MAKDFTDLVAWQEAAGLAADVAALARRLSGPGALNAASQMRRAAESIPANIAEGYGRGPGRDFARFCRISAASAAELESHVRVAIATGRLRGDLADPTLRRTRRVRALVRGLLLKVATRPAPNT